LLLTATALLILGIGCESEATKAAKAKARQEAEEQRIEEAKATIERLKPRFKYKKSPSNLFDSYNHKFVNAEPDAYIAAAIYGNNLHVVAVYPHNEKKIPFSCIMINIGYDVMDFYSITHTYGIITEVLHFEKNDRYRLYKLFASSPGQKVRVCYMDAYTSTYNYTLDEQNHNAICETVEFYDALMTLKKAGIDPQTMERIPVVEDNKPVDMDTMKRMFRDTNNN
jgi:hypothetical protein